MGQTERKSGRYFLAALRPLVVATVALALRHTAASAAEIHAEVSVNYNPEFQNIPGALPQFVAAEHLNALGGVADAKAALGWIRLNAFADALVIEPFVNHVTGYVYAEGRFEDTINVLPSNTALLGTPGTVTFALRVDGFVAAGGSPGSLGPDYPAGYGSAGLIGYVNSDSIFERHTEQPNGEPGSNFHELVEVTLNIIFGVPTDISVRFNASASAFFDDPNVEHGSAAFGESDMSNTLEWQGITRVVDEFDNEIAAYTVSSASGTDYRNAIEAPPIPEPATMVLLVGSCLLFPPRYAIARPSFSRSPRKRFGTGIARKTVDGLVNV